MDVHANLPTVDLKRIEIDLFLRGLEFENFTVATSAKSPS